MKKVLIALCSMAALAAGPTYAGTGGGVTLGSGTGLYVRVDGGMWTPQASSDTDSFSGTSAGVINVGFGKTQRLGTLLRDRPASGWNRLDLRGEIAVGYHAPATYENTLKIIGTVNETATWKTDISAVTLLPNLYLDVGPFYVGLGAGLSSSSTSTIDLKTSRGETGASESGATQFGLALQGHVGLNVPVMDNVFLDVGYRFLRFPIAFGSENVTAGSTMLTLKNGAVEVDQFLAGFRYHF